jgi:hypothetical protein
MEGVKAEATPDSVFLLLRRAHARRDAMSLVDLSVQRRGIGSAVGGAQTAGGETDAGAGVGGGGLVGG